MTTASEPFDAQAFLDRAVSPSRARLLVDVKLDPIPGWGHDADDWQRLLQHYLDTAAPVYEPAVSVVENASVDEVLVRHAVHGKTPEETACACDRLWRRDAEYRAHLAAALNTATEESR